MQLNWEVFDELTDIGVAHVGPDRRVVRCNNCFARQFHQDAIHMPGTDVIDLTSPEDRERAHQNFDALLSGQTASIRHSKRYIAPGGASFSRMLETVAIDGPGLLSFIYEYDDGNKDARIQQLEGLLSEVLSLMGGKVNINMSQTNDRSQNANSGGGAIQQQQGLGQTAVIAFFVMVGVIAVAAMLYLMGGNATIERGDTEIRLDSGDTKSQKRLD
ncbi:MAG: hypothetical protein AAF745_02585 [Planctomycetota bacterium]